MWGRSHHRTYDSQSDPWGRKSWHLQDLFSLKSQAGENTKQGVYVGDSIVEWLNGYDLEAGRSEFKPCLFHLLCWVCFVMSVNISELQLSC